MKKYVKRVLLVSGIAIFLLLLLTVISLYRFIASLSPMDTREIVPGIYTIKDSTVNMFLIKVQDKYIAIDAGNNSANIEKNMGLLKIDPDKIIAVFLTHTDADHVKGLKLFKNTKVYISKEEEQMISGKIRRFFFFKNKLDHDYGFIGDGQVISLFDLKIKGILIPGHTAGAMAYLVNGKYLFTGDTISLRSGKADMFYPKLSVNTEVHRRSIRKLAGLQGIKYIFTGHHGFSDNFRETFLDWDK